jgi:ribosome biogenesis GTPase
VIRWHCGSLCALLIINPHRLPPNFIFLLEPGLPCVHRSLRNFPEDTALNLEDFGWNTFFESHCTNYQNENLLPARVSFQGRGMYRLMSECGELLAQIGGALRHEWLDSGDLPVCGDWVLVDKPASRERTVIRFLLPRKTFFSRKQAGTAMDRQVVAANVDTICLVSGLDSDFNPRRIERYLAIAWESGAYPVIVLNKADICLEVSDRVAEAMSLAPGVPVLAMSATDGRGIEDILNYTGQGQTIAFLGSSGVGKSSIVNQLLGRSIQEIREADSSTGRGLHTTSARQLFLLPSGGLIMDTPGMRELQIWSVNVGLDTAFDDIKALAEKCRFRDCNHQQEPGCCVQSAVLNGELDARRLTNYFKIRKEACYIDMKRAHSASWVEKERWKKVARAARKRNPVR